MAAAGLRAVARDGDGDGEKRRQGKREEGLQQQGKTGIENDLNTC